MPKIQETTMSTASHKTAANSAYRGIAASAWIIYAVIVFEILFMVSPFAFYYYSIYSLPLNLLQDSPVTGWLTLHILPHFSYTESVVSNVLILCSWPLILIGLTIFLLGFAQIYWAKFTGKGAVAAGLYRKIRHPQYLALAILGLGTTIFWSRFIVLIAYVTMLCLYYALARLEERICLQKFGEKYQQYLTDTGMFLPHYLTGWLPAWKLDLSRDRWTRPLLILALYPLLMYITISGGWLLKLHVLEQINARYRDSMVMIALHPLDKSALQRIEEMLIGSREFESRRAAMGMQRVIAYVAPASWSVPELGLVSDGAYSQSGMMELLHPTIHGNSLEFDANQISVLITEPIVFNDDAKGQNLLLSTLGYEPRILIRIDLTEGRIISLNDEPYESHWRGIPVPVY
jgi:protein-S-isoprenylcysteine O-methyltransferase Ste14